MAERRPARRRPPAGTPAGRLPDRLSPAGTPAAGRLPDRLSLASARRAAADCTACDLFAHATQTVFGEGPARAPVMLVGEQPGDVEDREGRPFVGPAGQLLDAALEEAGVDRRLVYATNVVKHFKWEPRGKRRIHARPTAGQVQACRPWLDGEIALVRPNILVCLGATAAQALLGRSFRVSRQRGAFVPSSLAPLVMATVHPSSILRARDDASRDRDRKAFIEDLRIVAAALTRAPQEQGGARR